MPLVAVVALRLIACSVFTFVAWRWIGLVGIVISAPLFGIALARPILEAIEASALFAKWLAYRKLNGRHYEHRGYSVDIAEDSTFDLWVKIDDARKVLPDLPSDQVLERMFPEGILIASSQRVGRIRAEALVSYLGKSTEANSLKFRLWLRREVLLPANNRRKRS